MHRSLLALAAVATLAASGSARAGCLGGAVVGGVAGHVAGRHAGIGAVGGCIVGHHMAVVKKRDRMVAQGRGSYDAHHRFHRN